MMKKMLITLFLVLTLVLAAACTGAAGGTDVTIQNASIAPLR
jgi:hypothetical protein